MARTPTTPEVAALGINAGNAVRIGTLIAVICPSLPACPPQPREPGDPDRRPEQAEEKRRREVIGED